MPKGAICIQATKRAGTTPRQHPLRDPAWTTKEALAPVSILHAGRALGSSPTPISLHLIASQWAKRKDREPIPAWSLLKVSELVGLPERE